MKPTRIFGMLVISLLVLVPPALFTDLQPRTVAAAVRVEDKPDQSPAAILRELRAGNARFVKAVRTRSLETGADAKNREKTAKGQAPIVSLLTCADSRIAPEFVFDTHLGTIFTVRNAGNVVNGDVLGSIEYGVEHLHTPLVLVMGHTACGAVKAVNAAGDKPLPGNLKSIQANMSGLKASLRPEENTPAFINRLCAENAKQQARRLLAESELLRKEVKEGKAIIVVGMYNLETGEVAIVEENVKP